MTKTYYRLADLHSKAMHETWKKGGIKQIGAGRRRKTGHGEGRRAPPKVTGTRNIRQDLNKDQNGVEAL